MDFPAGKRRCAEMQSRNQQQGPAFDVFASIEYDARRLGSTRAATARLQ